MWEFLLFDEQSSTYSEFHSKVYWLERGEGGRAEKRERMREGGGGGEGEGEGEEGGGEEGGRGRRRGRREN